MTVDLGRPPGGSRAARRDPAPDARSANGPEHQTPEFSAKAQLDRSDAPVRRDVSRIQSTALDAAVSSTRPRLPRTDLLKAVRVRSGPE
ncbi:hypothetical protein D4764_01G0019840 [Takifugu flavidus]|uniref:Uncharacterized protein n=1 Tax=Takifugu flavidus TaxID=433684 RepID=A0A5C6PT90_9TELE|nr:hypothetical protein D4764_01G0019840 [Takifugu flavidus]